MTDEEKKLVIDFTRDYYEYALTKNEKGEPTDCIERYVDYRDEFPESAIGKILASDDPECIFFDTVNEWDINCDDWAYEDQFFIKLENFAKEHKLDIDECRDVVYDNFFWTYPESFLNPEVNVVIGINSGDMNHDFVDHNILNYNKDSGYCNGLEETAGLYWLAKQQKRLGLLKKEIKKSDGYSNKTCSDESKFVKTTINELINLTSHMGELVFLVKMSLKNAINLKTKLSEIENKFNRYHPTSVEGNPFGYITLDKSVNCGLYDSWNGGGSLLEIELEKDVKIPLQYIFNLWSDYKNPYGYTIDSVYGLIDSCWVDGYKGYKEK